MFPIIYIEVAKAKNRLQLSGEHSGGVKDLARGFNVGEREVGGK